MLSLITFYNFSYLFVSFLLCVFLYVLLFYLMSLFFGQCMQCASEAWVSIEKPADWGLFHGRQTMRPPFDTAIEEVLDAACQQNVAC